MGAPPERVAAAEGRKRLSVLSLVCAALLVVTAAIQLVASARLVADHVPDDLVSLVPSAVVAITAACASFARSPEWRARVLGAAAGIWFTSGWAPQFVLRFDMASVVHWVILGLIGASILAGWRDGSLPAGRTTLDLAGVAAVVTALVIIAIEFGLLVVWLTIHPLP